MVTLLDCLSNDSEQTAVIIPHKTTPITLSHSSLLSKTLSFQAKLAALGINPKDAVCISFPNTIEFIIAFFAISFQRAIASPLNPAYKEDEFKFYIEDLNATLLLVPEADSKQKDEAVRAARSCGAGIAEVCYNGEEMVIRVVDTGRLEGRQPAGFEKPESNDIALILHTSGTTGRPKAVPLTHRNLRRTTSMFLAIFWGMFTDHTRQYQIDI
jgi:acyl-CoA synthetase (AMP-forming)/AMP-acid ligase II